MAEYEIGQGTFSIVPSFKGVQQAITEEARKWGVSAGDSFGDAFSDTVKAATTGLLNEDKAAAEKGSSAGGKFADAFKTRIDAALKNLPDANVGIDATAADRELADLRLKLESLRNQRIGIDIPPEKALAELAEIKAALVVLGRSSESIDVKLNTAGAITEIVGLEGEVKTAESVLTNLGNGGPGDISAIGGAAEESGASITDFLLPALALVATALIPIGGLLAGGLTTIPSILGGLGLGFAAIAIAAPAIKSAVTGLFDPLIKQLTPFVEGAILPGFTKGLQDIVPLFQDVAPLIVATAGGMGDLAQNFGQFLGSAQGTSQINSILSAGAGFMKQMGNNALTLLKAFTSIGSQSTPIVSALAGGITNLVNAFAKWVQNGGFQSFLAWLKANGPSIVSDVQSIVKGFAGFIIAIEPLGQDILNIAGAIGKVITFADPLIDFFARWATAIFLLGLPQLIGLIESLASHWQQAWADIKQWTLDAFNAVKSAVFDPLVNFFTQTIPHALDVTVGFFAALPGRVGGALSGVFLAIAAAFGDAAGWVNTNIIQPVENFFKGLVTDIGKALSTLASIIEKPFQDAWKIIGPIISGIESAVGFITGGSGSGDQTIINAATGKNNGPRAFGGPVSPFGTYLVGERGPEILQLGAFGGNVIPNSALSNIPPMNLTGPGGALQHVENQYVASAVDPQAIGQQLAFLSRGRVL